MNAGVVTGATPVGASLDRPEPPTAGHLEQLDFFRIVTFAAVVAVHTIGNGSAGYGVPANGVAVVFHHTREAFFFLSGFVLAHSVRNRALRLGAFWSKRFRLIGIPYLVWSVLYIWYAVWRNGGPVTLGIFWHRVWVATLLGQASYHLYFLLVSMQIYLVFPLLNKLRRLGTTHPIPVLAVLAVFDGVLLQFAHVTHRAGSTQDFLATWAYITVLPYLIWVVGGSIAAWNLPRLQPYLWRHRRPIGLTSLATLGIALGAYAFQIHTGWKPQDAGEVMQPVMLAWGAGAICLQGLLALVWVRHRKPDSRATRAVRWGSSASFGVYLVHPILLDRIFAHGFSGNRTAYVGQPWTHALPRITVLQPLASIWAWAITLALSCLVIGVVRLTPLSMPLTGRDWGWRRHRDALRTWRSGRGGRGRGPAEPTGSP